MPWWPSSLSSSSSSSPNSNNRRLTRAKQLRHVRNQDIYHLDLLRSSSSPPPHPLPLPDSPAAFSPADKFVNNKSKPSAAGYLFRLPSPNGGSLSPNSINNNSDEKGRGRGRERERERERERVKTAVEFPNGSNTRVASQDGRWSVDAQERVDARRGIDAEREADSTRTVHRAETWSSRNLPRNATGADRAQENISLDIPFRSAPPSPHTSPMRSPQRLPSGDIFLLCPMELKHGPELASSFQHAAIPEGPVVSRDSSPLHSPQPQAKNSVPTRKSTSGPASPRHPKLSIEICSPHYDRNILMNGHPLPLPPTPASSSQTSPVPQVASRPEFFPMKNRWTKGKLIGRGTFGSVYVATNRETGALCAMKEVELCPDDPKSAESMRQLEQEIKVLSHLKHPNIVQYYGSEIVDDRFYIYLEYVYRGSINKYVREHCGAITEAVVRNFTRHIVSGLAYLHGRKTIHRDIKGANLLVDASGVVKLADFGMAKHLTGQAADLSLKGSPYWMAPELMQAVMQRDNSSDLAFAVDIWSLGCTIIEMLTGKPPWCEYEGAAAMFKVLKDSPPIPETLSPEGKDFLCCCFRRNPADRPSATRLLDHPFLRNSQQLDIPSSRLELNLFNLTEKAHSPRERHDHKPDKMPMSPSRWTANGKGANNSETGAPSHVEASDLTACSRHSPRSILESVTSLSPIRARGSPQSFWLQQAR